MDGFTDMALKLTENLLLLVSLFKELFALALEKEVMLAESIELMWKGVIGGSAWLGYAAYALYGLGEDYNFSTEVCEAMGYGFYVIDNMNYIVAFAKPAADAPKAAATGNTDALAAAALNAAGAATGGKLPAGVADVVKAAASGDVKTAAAVAAGAAAGAVVDATAKKTI